ncbi:MAG: helix-turn-helix domain-containing protein [Roseovarius sp.]
MRGSDIAEQCECSLRQIERLFRKHAGVSPMQYYILLRLERASELVLQTNLSFHEIAAATGFSSSSSLTKKLKAQVGVSPYVMRERGWGKNGVVVLYANRRVIVA